MRKKFGFVNQCSAWLRSCAVMVLLAAPFATALAGETLVSPRPALQSMPADNKITGQVLDENGEPLIGVTVTVKGTKVVAITDIDGNFTIAVPASNSVLQFSYLGYKLKEERAANGMQVRLDPDSNALTEVVVTALGIKKEAKSLSYNVQQVNSEGIMKVQDANFVNSLNGKVAGVQINANASGIGGSSRVVMRGAKSIDGNNNVLYVIDGVPMVNSQSSLDDNALAYSGNGQTGDATAMLNPDDIESISALTGPSAAALYGSDAANGVTAEYIDTTNYFRGWSVNLPKKGDWARFADVDFNTITDGYLVVCARANANTSFCLREKSATGKVIAKIEMTVKSEQGPFRRDMSGQWLTLTAPLEYTPKGVTDLVVTCEGEGVDVDWVLFKNRPKYFSPASSQPASPDNDGFIRRWMLLDPIDKPNSGNTVFTDSYLREHFNREYFKGQQTILPKDGQKVQAVFQQEQAPAGFGRGHALDSENYNVKLFRFAEKWGEKVYGVLFWAVTVIDCPEEIKDVRLAVGSNSASMWWLNGEEALLLSGDRRMVKDDAMSPRLTLKKGRNILRGAIINGPGMSDFCVRFLDEKGNPVTNFTINLQK